MVRLAFCLFFLTAGTRVPVFSTEKIDEPKGPRIHFLRRDYQIFDSGKEEDHPKRLGARVNMRHVSRRIYATIFRRYAVATTPGQPGEDVKPGSERFATWKRFLPGNTFLL